ncbi:ChaN family lipoprotein [Acidovorax sp. LjRoot129]|uniref:ChaN family lipoprotein n=1 Tax=Acidovorax sp. LjRoot129 TaxID=3342260 RepID=UPI003ECFED52
MLTACAGAGPKAAVPSDAWPARLAALLPTDVLLLGEQHDAPEHQRLQRDTVLWLAARGQLAAVVMEMAEQGHGTAGLPRDATETQAQAALQLKDAAWPWKAYGPVVMAAVAAGVPVLGGNLPRADMRAAMADTRWDQHLPAPALERQYQALRDGHCGLLPESQIAPMARIQIARDASLARTAQAARKSGQTVLLIAGGGHVQRSVGVPTHWPADFNSKVALAQAGHAPLAINTEADAVIATPALPAKDHCAELRQQWGQGMRSGG